MRKHARWTRGKSVDFVHAAFRLNQRFTDFPFAAGARMSEPSPTRPFADPDAAARKLDGDRQHR
jgi:hypothetical protein